MSYTQAEITKLRNAAYAADEAFSAELQRAYGNRAGDARYQWKHDDPKVEAAMRAKLAADKAYWDVAIKNGLDAYINSHKGYNPHSPAKRAKPAESGKG